MIEDFIKQLFLTHTYTPGLIFLYTISGILAGFTRLTIRDGNKAQFRRWWDDGSLWGAVIISVAGALLFDNNFVWSFLGGYFFIYVLSYIQKLLDKSRKGENEQSSG